MARGPGYTAKKRAEIAERRRRVAALYTRHINQEDIARQVGVDQSTVSDDIKALLKEWREGALSDIADVRARELGELDEIERDCALQFAASKDPGWIDRRLKCKERRSKLLGLDAPERKELTGKDGGALEVKVDDARQQLTARLAALAARQRERDSDSQSESAGSEAESV